jgi:hypothetical protein
VDIAVFSVTTTEHETVEMRWRVTGGTSTDPRNLKRRSADVGIATMTSGWKHWGRTAFVASSAGERERRRVASGARNRLDMMPGVARGSRRERSRQASGEFVLPVGFPMPVKVRCPASSWSVHLRN